MNKHFEFIPALLILLLACNKGDQQVQPQPTVPASQKFAGKWILVKSEVTLTFDNGTTQSANVNGSGTDYMELKFVKKDGAEESGDIKNVYMGQESTGNWVYFDQDKSLDITYTSLSPHYFLFRKVEKADDKTLILTADNDKVLQQYTLNGLGEIGGKKLTGGTIREEWRR